MKNISIPAASIPLADGEHYAGLILNDDGTPSHASTSASYSTAWTCWLLDGGHT